LKDKKLELDLKRLKASIIAHDLAKKRKDKEGLESKISGKNAEIAKIRDAMSRARSEAESYEMKIGQINGTIRKSTGFEQEKLNQEIAKLMADLAGLNVRLENYGNKLSEIARQKIDMEKAIGENEISIRGLQKEPLRKKQDEIGSKKAELENLEKQRKKFYSLRSELKSLRERIEDRKKALENHRMESDYILRQIDLVSESMFDKKTTSEKLAQLRTSVAEKESALDESLKKESEILKTLYSSESEIKRQEKILGGLAKMEVCPVCKSKITKEHVHAINSEFHSEMKAIKESIESLKRDVEGIEKRKSSLKEGIKSISAEISKRESDLLKISSIDDKKEQIKSLNEKMKGIEKEISEFEKTKSGLEKSLNSSIGIEQKYERLRLEVEEISGRSGETVDSEISFKQRELERARISLKQLSREEEDIGEELSAIKKDHDEKEGILEDKREQEEELSRKFKKLISEREALESGKRKEEMRIMESQNSIRGIEQEINAFSIEKARVDAEIENLDTEMLEFKGVEVVGGSRESLAERLEKAKESFSGMGSVNLLSLDVYDSVKKQYDEVNGKVEVIRKEKEDILRVIHEIDVKKKKTFMKTFNSLNETFSRNFSALSSKGVALLELENPKEPFEDGISITIKTGHGKYLDVTSLSGGERVLVALSLIFAIQELNPYHFYILDEVDASLDKRNSERLAGLFNKYMQKGQYIIITHNDEIISNAKNLYGVSMNDGISKIVSLRV
jgi:chromosome segregation ATPase